MREDMNNVVTYLPNFCCKTNVRISFHFISLVGITGAHIVWQESGRKQIHSLNNNTAHTLSLNLNLEADRSLPNYE